MAQAFDSRIQSFHDYKKASSPALIFEFVFWRKKAKNETALGIHIFLYFIFYICLIVLSKTKRSVVVLYVRNIQNVT